jgi:hypothetical protein
LGNYLNIKEKIMAERNKTKERTCDTCGKKFETTAKGIKKHEKTHRKRPS